MNKELLKWIAVCGMLGTIGISTIGHIEAAPKIEHEANKPIKFCNGPTIRVLIGQSLNSALLEVKGPYRVLKYNNGALLSFGISGKRFVVHAIPEGLRWGEEYPDVNQMIVIPDKPETMMYVNGIQYRGAIAVYQHRNKIMVVNDVDVEDYVKSILGMQFNSAMSRETMAALAIAARTDTYYKIISHPSDIWHISAVDANYQGYGVTCRNNGVDEAVDCTKHMVMENVVLPRQDQLPATFATAWTENSAGKTAPFHVVFKQDKNAPKDGVASPLAAKAREASAWTFAISKEELAAISGLTKIDNIALNADKDSGKVQSVRFQSAGVSKDLDFFALQEELGSDRLQSNDFKVIITNTGAKFVGYGKGHGVGLCLFSAEQMAQKGLDARRILYTFYPNTKITIFGNSQIR